MAKIVISNEWLVGEFVKLLGIQANYKHGSKEFENLQMVISFINHVRNVSTSFKEEIKPLIEKTITDTLTFTKANSFIDKEEKPYKVGFNDENIKLEVIKILTELENS